MNSIQIFGNAMILLSIVILAGGLYMLSRQTKNDSDKSTNHTN